MKRISVFEESRVNGLEVIQEEICSNAPWRYVMLECRLHLNDETKRKVVYHDYTDYDLEKEIR